MPDEPHFPAPGEKIVDPYREPEKPAPPEPSHKIVTRAEPPPSSSRPKRAALTAEEKKALIAVTAAQAPVWRAPLTRSPIFIVTGIISIFTKMLFGAYAMPINVVIFIAAVAWVARPLFRRDRFS